jgi:hypothetical protein
MHRSQFIQLNVRLHTWQTIMRSIRYHRRQQAHSVPDGLSRLCEWPHENFFELALDRRRGVTSGKAKVHKDPATERRFRFR